MRRPRQRPGRIESCRIAYGADYKWKGGVGAEGKRAPRVNKTGPARACAGERRTGDPTNAETQRIMERLVDTYERHVQEAAEAGDNVRDRPKREGYRGEEWRGHESKVVRTYYRGGTEEDPRDRKEADGEEGEEPERGEGVGERKGRTKVKYRSCMGLAPREPWERSLLPELTIEVQQVERTLQRIREGETGRLLPPLEPHRYVQYETAYHSKDTEHAEVMREERREAARAAAEEAVRALPDDANRDTVIRTLRHAWENSIEEHVRTALGGRVGEDMTELLLRAAVAESRRPKPGPPPNRVGIAPGPWTGGGYKGYAMVGEETLRRDPLTRTLLRYDEWEKGRVVHTTEGVQVQMDDKTQALMRRTSSGEQTWWAIASTLLPLHYYHHFTRCAFTDGSLDDPRRRGGEGSRRVAYGIWEGIPPEEEVPEPGVGWGSKDANARIEICMAHD